MPHSISWYKQFWPWFLIMPPLMAVIGGIATIVIAATDSDGLVVDDYYRQGLAINQRLDRQRSAERLGLGGDFSIDITSGMVQLKLKPARPELDQLQLRLVHPTRAQRDLAGTLYRDMHGVLSGALGFPAAGRWQVVVEPSDNTWRLIGELWLPEQTATHLDPG